MVKDTFLQLVAGAKVTHGCDSSDSGEEERDEAVTPVVPALVSADMYVVAQDLMSLSSQDLWDKPRSSWERIVVKHSCNIRSCLPMRVLHQQQSLRHRRPPESRRGGWLGSSNVAQSLLSALGTQIKNIGLSCEVCAEPSALVFEHL